MTSQHRPMDIAPIPPFRGGPLQARHAPNTAAPVPSAHAKAASTPSGSARQPQTTSSSNRSGRSDRPREVKAPTTSSRLANEKKQDFRDPANIGPWRLGEIIGRGASGRVRIAEHSSTGQQAAVKIVPKHVLVTSRMSLRDAGAKQDKMTLGIEREIVIMKLIEHPNLLGLWDVYETSKELFLIMEYVAGGELFDHLVQRGRLTPPEARSYFRQIIFGMDYCHRFNICHRDLKPENLLLDATKRIVKVADFGMAALQPTERMLETSCGSPHYASPEIVSGKRYKGSASDIWSCGIILFALLCGRLPFDDKDIGQLLAKVKIGRFDMPDHVESLARDLIWRMLEVDPERRIKMVDIMRHPWFTDNGRKTSQNPVTTSLDHLASGRYDRDSIDLDILGNLKTLWPEYDERMIVEQLTSPGMNWQKTFYSLLVQHRENHSADEEDDLEPEPPMPPVGGNSLGLSLGIPASTDAAKTTQLRATVPAPGGSSPRKNDGKAKAPLVAHRPAPTPAGAGARSSPIKSQASAASTSSPLRSAALEVQRPAQLSAHRSPVRESIEIARPPSTSPTRGRPLPSPTASPSPSPTKARSSSTTRSAPYGAPQIVSPQLERRSSTSSTRAGPSSPVKGYATPSTATPGRRSSISTDVTPKPSARSASQSTAPATITVPQVGDATMQRFFQEIADELANIRATGERPDSLQEKVERLRDMAAAGAVPLPPTPGIPQQQLAQTSMHPPRAPSRNGGSRPSSRMSTRSATARRADGPCFDPRFDDAEDDVSDDGTDLLSLRSGTASEASTPYTPASPLPLTLPSPKVGTMPLAVADKDRLSSTRRPALLKTATSPRPASIMSNSSANSGSGPTGTLGRKKSFLSSMRRSKDSHAAAAEGSQGRNSLAYERLQQAGAAAAAADAAAGHNVPGTPASTNTAWSHGSRQSPTRLQAANPGLGLDINAAGTGSIAAPSIRSPVSVTSPVPSTPASLREVASPRQSWFTGLFNWKPATFTLMSVENFATTHAEVKRLLHQSGARVFVEDSENAAVLKCSLAEVRDSSSSGSSGKPVRFRVEFAILPMSSANSAHPSPALSAVSNRSGGSHSPALSSHSRASGAAMAAGLQNASGEIYATSVTLIQEKGALSTFKAVYHSLRKQWILDQRGGAYGLTPNSPAVVGLGVGTFSPR